MFKGKKILVLGAHPKQCLLGWTNDNISMTRYNTLEKRKKHAEDEKHRRDKLGDKHRQYKRGEYQKNKEYNQQKARENRIKNRLSCITHYSNGKMICSCCKCNDYDFLIIDHINNDGAEHRKTVSSGSLYSWLKTNNFPKGFQVLCYNCNSVKGHYGYCKVHMEVDRNI